MNTGIDSPGRTKVWNSPSTSPPRTLTAPTSVIDDAAGCHRWSRGRRRRTSPRASGVPRSSRVPWTARHRAGAATAAHRADGNRALRQPRAGAQRPGCRWSVLRVSLVRSHRTTTDPSSTRETVVTEASCASRTPWSWTATPARCADRGATTASSPALGHLPVVVLTDGELPLDMAERRAVDRFVAAGLVSPDVAGTARGAAGAVVASSGAEHRAVGESPGGCPMRRRRPALRRIPRVSAPRGTYPRWVRWARRGSMRRGSASASRTPATASHGGAPSAARRALAGPGADGRLLGGGEPPHDRGRPQR